MHAHYLWTIPRSTIVHADDIRTVASKFRGCEGACVNSDKFTASTKSTLAIKVMLWWMQLHCYRAWQINTFIVYLVYSPISILVMTSNYCTYRVYSLHIRVTSSRAHVLLEY